MLEQGGLREQRVLIVGAGGLGTPAAWLLAKAGVSTLILADPDVVELSNLNRQVLFHAGQVGQPKAEVLARELHRRFPQSRLQPMRLRVDAKNALGLLSQADFLVDATDGIESKLLLNDAAVLAGKPLAHAGIVGLYGQAMTILPGQSACLRCLFPDTPSEEDLPSCQSAGIVGPLAAALASVQGAEALRYLRGCQPQHANQLLRWDALRWRWHAVAVPRRENCPMCGSHPVITPATLGEYGGVERFTTKAPRH